MDEDTPRPTPRECHMVANHLRGMGVVDMEDMLRDMERFGLHKDDVRSTITDMEERGTVIVSSDESVVLCNNLTMKQDMEALFAELMQGQAEGRY